MAVQYEDRHVVLDDDAITIQSICFPTGGALRIRYSDIRSVREYQMGLLSGRLTLFGTMDLRHWFHFDAGRSRKARAIELETGALLLPTITPDDVGKVMSILAMKVKPQGSGTGQGSGQLKLGPQGTAQEQAPSETGEAPGEMGMGMGQGHGGFIAGGAIGAGIGAAGFIAAGGASGGKAGQGPEQPGGAQQPGGTGQATGSGGAQGQTGGAGKGGANK